MSNYEDWEKAYATHLKNLYDIIPDFDPNTNLSKRPKKRAKIATFEDFDDTEKSKHKIDFKEFKEYVHKNSSGYISPYT